MWNPNFDCLVHKSPQFVAVLVQINERYIALSYFFKHLF